MWKQIKLITGVQFKGIWGFNQIRYGKDPKQKNRFILLAVVMAFLGLMIAVYSGLLSFGFAAIGMAYLIPSYLLAVVSVVILFFSIYKAGSIIFERKTYELMISLPVHPAAIVVSRFLTMYLQNLIIGLVIMLPATIVYGVMVKPGFLFYITMIAGAILMPLLPMTIATAAGAVITAISSRMKHRNLVTILLTMSLTVGLLLLSINPSTGNFEITDETMQNMGVMMEQQIFSIYPPARWFAAGVVEGNLLAYLGFVGLSIGMFVLMVSVVQRKFAGICALLNSRVSGRKYQMGELKQNSLLTALYRRELKHYFSSSLYVMNTMMGDILMVILAIFLCSMGSEKMDALFGLPGISSRLLPMLLALAGSLSVTTACAISIEGKEWWNVKSLPITVKQLFDSKMLVNLTVALPCYVITEVILLFAMKGDLLQKLWILLIPLLYILFITVAGLTVNCKFPVFTWESDAAVVKQSASVAVTMLISMLSVVIPGIILMVFPNWSSHLIMGVLAVILVAATLLLYYKNSKVDLRLIN